METIAEKSKRVERQRIAKAVESFPIGKYSVVGQTSFDLAFDLRKAIADYIREGGK